MILIHPSAVFLFVLCIYWIWSLHANISGLTYRKRTTGKMLSL